MRLFILPITANLISFGRVKIEPVSVWKSRGTKTAAKKLILIIRAHGREDSQHWEHEMRYDAFFLLARWIFSPRAILSPAPTRQPKELGSVGTFPEHRCFVSFQEQRNRAAISWKGQAS